MKIIVLDYRSGNAYIEDNVPNMSSLEIEDYLSVECGYHLAEIEWMELYNDEIPHCIKGIIQNN